MANTLYDAARQRFLEAQINWMTDTVKILLVDTGSYTPQTEVPHPEFPFTLDLRRPIGLM